MTKTRAAVCRKKATIERHSRCRVSNLPTFKWLASTIAVITSLLATVPCLWRRHGGARGLLKKKQAWRALSNAGMHFDVGILERMRDPATKSDPQAPIAGQDAGPPTILGAMAASAMPHNPKAASYCDRPSRSRAAIISRQWRRSS
jgi:hypothetical protein